MAQSTLINTFFNPGISDRTFRRTANNSANGYDSFYSMLSDRIRNGSPSERAAGTAADEPLRKSSGVLSGKNSPIAGKPADRRETKARPVDADNDPSGVTEEEDKTVDKLKSVVSLLEELLAYLGIKAEIPSDAAKEAAGGTAGLSASAGPVPGSGSENTAIDILKALLEGNSEKLQSILDKIDESRLSPDLKNLVSHARIITDKAAGDPDGLKKLLDPNFEQEGVNGSEEEMLDQLKSRCAEAIAKLKAGISVLEASKARSAPDVRDSGTTDEEAGAPDRTEAASLLGDKAEIGSYPDKEPDSKTEGEELTEKKARLRESHEDSKALTPEEKTSDGIVNLHSDDISAPIHQNDRIPLVSKAERPLPDLPDSMTESVRDQVITQVKLIAGENAQELEMHLKPESLGRLSLKIIHERGEILAKFTAENEQVKAILESNIQLLKDALEKSGFSVQNLSVSVGNGSDRNNGRPQGFGEDSRPYPKNSDAAWNGPASAETVYDRTQEIRDYYGQSSQINLTA